MVRYRYLYIALCLSVSVPSSRASFSQDVETYLLHVKLRIEKLFGYQDLQDEPSRSKRINESYMQFTRTKLIGIATCAILVVAIGRSLKSATSQHTVPSNIDNKLIINDKVSPDLHEIKNPIDSAPVDSTPREPESGSLDGDSSECEQLPDHEAPLEPLIVDIVDKDTTLDPLSAVAVQPETTAPAESELNQPIPLTSEPCIETQQPTELHISDQSSEDTRPAAAINNHAIAIEERVLNVAEKAGNVLMDAKKEVGTLIDKADAKIEAFSEKCKLKWRDIKSKMSKKKKD